MRPLGGFKETSGHFQLFPATKTGILSLTKFLCLNLRISISISVVTEKKKFWLSIVFLQEHTFSGSLGWFPVANVALSCWPQAELRSRLQRTSYFWFHTSTFSNLLPKLHHSRQGTHLLWNIFFFLHRFSAITPAVPSAQTSWDL